MAGLTIDRLFWAARAGLPRCYTAIIQGQYLSLLAPFESEQTEVARALRRMSERQR